MAKENEYCLIKMVRLDLYIPKLVIKDDSAPGNVRLKQPAYYGRVSLHLTRDLTKG